MAQTLDQDHREYDYIICGGGTSGCVIASTLAAQSNASILLVEAGRDAGTAPDVLVPGKYVHQLTADPKGLWQIPTVPQKELNDRSIMFLRGKQLGGSSAINYMALARGPSADYDDWAKLTGDEGWRWESVLPLMKDLEDFRPARPAGFECYADPDPAHHGSGGPIKVGFGDVMTPGVETFFEACKEVGIQRCRDNNSGNPVGVGLAQMNTGGGIRSYAANAFLDAQKREKLSNLRIINNISVDRIRFEGKKAVGVQLFDHNNGSEIIVSCRREVVVCQGTFGSPQLLMHSGIGNKAHLEDLGIRTIHHNSNVGSNMLDHSILTIEYRVDDTLPAHNKIFADPKALAEADASYAADKTGPHNIYGTSGAVAFPKLRRLLESREFSDLDQPTQMSLLEQSRPSAEIWLGSGPAAWEPASADESYITFELLLQNNQSKGNVCLQSSDPRSPPQIDPNFLKHPFDKRIAIETIRETLAIGKAESYRSVIRNMVHGPSGEDDSSILDFIRENLGQGYHSLGTCRMGFREAAESVVDAKFHVIGVDNLRVADLSVCPILTCNHTQINAYLIGQRCGEMLVAEFSAKCLSE